MSVEARIGDLITVSGVNGTWKVLREEGGKCIVVQLLPSGEGESREGVVAELMIRRGENWPIHGQLTRRLNARLICKLDELLKGRHR